MTPENLTDRILMVLAYGVSSVMLVGAADALYQGQWFTAFLAFSAFVLSYIPALFQRSFKIFLPIEFELTFSLFLFATIYLGSADDFYMTYWWWDKVLHTGSGFMLGFIGFLIVYIINSQIRHPIRMKASFVALFSFTFSMALAVLWEIFEFSMDQAFGFNMQRTHLNTDTMGDLIVNMAGALIMAALGYFYVKKVSVPVVDRLVSRFVHKNPEIFQKFRRKLPFKSKAPLSSSENSQLP